MARYGKKYWEDELDDMKAHRYDRKFRWHKLSVALGQNKRQRREASAKRGLGRGNSLSL